MRSINLSLAGAAILLTASTAFAADINAPYAPAPQAPVSYAPTGNWTGAYVGGSLGGSMGNAHVDDSAGGVTRQRNGFVGNVYGGYNNQVAPNVVLGGEATFGLNGATRSLTTANGTSARVSEEYNANIKGRAGYATGQTLIYGAVGPSVAVGHVSAPQSTDSNAHVGVVAGAGVEQQFSPNIVGRVEYDYTAYGNRTYNVNGQADSINLTNNAVTAGVAYKF